MKCPYCAHLGDKVVDSRESKEGEVIRRRRECLECGKRFTSYERIDEIPYMVVKKDGSRERFDRQKLIGGLLKACEKRPVSLAAVEEGIVPGGGVALIRAGRVLETMNLAGDQQIGVNIVKRAIEEPMRWIATNAGHEGSIVVQKVREMHDAEGFNALTDTYEDLVKAGVIDPAKVVRSALQNSSSIASLLLTTEALISEIPEEKKDAPAMPGGGGMGGMY